MANVISRLANDHRQILSSSIKSTLDFTKYLKVEAFAFDKTLHLVSTKPSVPCAEASWSVLEQEPAQKRSRIEHGESDYDERHNLKMATTVQEKVGIMVRLMALKDNGVKPNKPAKTFVTRQLLPFIKGFKDHFNSDQVAFCQAFPRYQDTKHKQECSSKCHQV